MTIKNVERKSKSCKLREKLRRRNRRGYLAGLGLRLSKVRKGKIR